MAKSAGSTLTDVATSIYDTAKGWFAKGPAPTSTLPTGTFGSIPQVGSPEFWRQERSNPVCPACVRFGDVYQGTMDTLVSDAVQEAFGTPAQGAFADRVYARADELQAAREASIARGEPPPILPAGGIIMPEAGLAAEGATQAVGQGFRSFSAFKRAIGLADKGMQWHHIVEKGGSNIERFGARSIHNLTNLVRLDVATHQRVSALYSSIRPGITGSTSLTVRKWLSNQSFEAQRSFGLEVIENIKAGLW